MNQVQTQEAPISERPNQLNDTTSKAPTKEELARETLRAALYASGIDHDSLEFISEGCLTALRAAGLLPKSLGEVVIPIAPSSASVSIAIFPPWVQDDGHWGHHAPRSRAVAERIARAVQAEYGGELTDRPDPHCSIFDIKDTDRDDMVRHVRYMVFYDLPEEPRP